MKHLLSQASVHVLKLGCTVRTVVTMTEYKCKINTLKYYTFILEILYIK